MGNEKRSGRQHPGHNAAAMARIAQARHHYATRSQRRPVSPCRVCGAAVHGQCDRAKKAA